MLFRLSVRLGHAALRAQGFRSRFVHTDVGRVHAWEYEGAGELPPMVVLHGIGARTGHLAPLLARLKREASRLIVPDLPGHGKSPVPYGGLSGATLARGLEQALDALIDEPAVVFGNSMGGMAAIRYAARRPEKVRGLLLVSPGGAPPHDGDLRGFLDLFRMRTRSEALSFTQRLYARPVWFAPLIANGVRRNFSQPALRAFVDQITDADLLSPDEVAGLTPPGRLIWGREEKLLPPEHLAFFKTHLPAHVEVFEPEGYGHCPQLDATDALVRDIRAFARDVLAPPAHTR